MKEVYNLGQHTRCAVIRLTNNNIYMRFYNNFKRYDSDCFYVFSRKACIFYNNQQVISLEEMKDSIRIDNFIDKLYHLYKKEKINWDKDDLNVIKAISYFIQIVMEESIKKLGPKINSLNEFHYAFIVPSEWEEEIRQDLIQLIFIQANLISKCDSKDRLLFYSDLESICYGLKISYRGNFFSKRGQNTILSRLVRTETDAILIKFDLIQTTNTLFDFPNAMLFPKIIQSNSITINSTYIKHHIETFLKHNLSLENHQIISILVESIYQNNLLEEYESNSNVTMDKLMNPLILDKIKSKLNQKQLQFMESIRLSNILDVIGKDILNNMKDICTNKYRKEYIFSMVKEKYPFKAKLDLSLRKWLEHVLKYNVYYLGTISGINIVEKNVRFYDQFKGAMLGVLESIQNSDMYCKPRILSSSINNLDATSASLLPKLKLDAIVHIDLSLKSTSLSCSLLNDGGTIVKTFDHNYFLNNDNSFPSLESFFHISSTGSNLNVKNQFIQFAEKYLMGSLSSFAYRDTIQKEDFMFKMIFILKDNNHEEEPLVTVRQQTYIKAFLLMYMIYIKNALENKLSYSLNNDNANKEIGYLISIENTLLKNVVGKKENLQDLINACELVKREDDNKTIRIITHGEELLTIIQQHLDVEFSLKSYFVLAHLHEDYVQLTLNQVVTDSCINDEQQEAIILQDEIIHIPNIYESLCQNMWDNIMQNNHFIHRCDQHNESNILNLFSLRTKVEFMKNFKMYISDNLLNNNPNSQTNNVLRLNNLCKCKICFTINDITTISFKPILQELATVASSSLINKNIFGNYLNIKYLFILIHFNRNQVTQKILARLLKEEMDDFNPEQGIETICMVLPKSFHSLLDPVVLQRSLLYNRLKIGNLHQICTENYAFSLRRRSGPDVELLYKEKRTDVSWVSTNDKIAIPFLKRGCVINNVWFDKILYIQKPKNLDSFFIVFYRYETINGFDSNEPFYIEDRLCEKLHNITIKVEQESYSLENTELPLMLSATSLGYSSSIQFSGKLVGQTTEINRTCEIGQPMTLVRG